jgi:hypothetical protein
MIYFLKGAIYHSKNIDNPEYYFQTNKVKFILEKKLLPVYQYGYC